ncbi:MULTISPECIES: hypothetical protein [unclassified Pantoea]|uniref:hypothetical protein n=1 Tax=unclassified Pantoea TaxID=2630326 RepID=UPI0001E0EF5F|nr:MULTISPECIES: hypothetical protein [unclassified Pantoea]EFM21939.1 hypothetical protein PanABDRAFT_0467 [Pantoea sp. aB]QNQ60792.1 hypothetical protein IAI47_20980 [Pantoea sp. MT58]
MSLQNLYRSTNENTTAIWAKNTGVGDIKQGNYYDPVRLALASGIQPPVSLDASRLIGELQQLTKDDPLADVLPPEGFHFTFLPLTLPFMNESEPLPGKVAELTKIWTGFDAKRIVIRDLRLVALPSQLLLAGIPDSTAIAMRQSFCESVLNSQWKNELQMRHSGSPLPAPFWHSTLLRYGADFLPTSLRQYIFERQSVNFGDVTGDLKLAKVNYNWTICYPLTI